MFMVAMGIALVGYTRVPDRAAALLLPEWGFTDSVAQLHRRRPRRGTVNALFNPYAAVPSMHVCFALMIGLPLARMAASTAGRASFWALYPLLVTLRRRRDRQPLVVDAFLGAAHRGASSLRCAARLAGAASRPGRLGLLPACHAPAPTA